MNTKHRPKLTLKAAKTLAIKELGTAAGLKAHEINSDYQRYEVKLGNHTAVISNELDYWGIASVAFATTRTYYSITTLEEDISITENERRKNHNEFIRDAAGYSSEIMMEALLEQYGFESCHRMLESAENNK